MLSLKDIKIQFFIASREIMEGEKNRSNDFRQMLKIVAIALPRGGGLPCRNCERATNKVLRANNSFTALETFSTSPVLF